MTRSLAIVCKGRNLTCKTNANFSATVTEVTLSWKKKKKRATSISKLLQANPQEKKTGLDSYIATFYLTQNDFSST